MGIVKIPKGERVGVLCGSLALAEDAYVEVDDSFSQADMEEMLRVRKELEPDEPPVFSQSILDLAAPPNKVEN